MSLFLSVNNNLNQNVILLKDEFHENRRCQRTFSKKSSSYEGDYNSQNDANNISDFLWGISSMTDNIVCDGIG